MRLISQDGMIDVPYEISALSIGRMGESATIYVRSKLLDEKPCVFATYFTEVKALKVMEMLREQYMRNNALYIDRENNARVIPQNSLFKFPADEEVEV